MADTYKYEHRLSVAEHELIGFGLAWRVKCMCGKEWRYEIRWPGDVIKDHIAELEVRGETNVLSNP